jgi:dihydropyrimidinase
MPQPVDMSVTSCAKKRHTPKTPRRKGLVSFALWRDTLFPPAMGLEVHMDLIVRGGTLVTAEGAYRADIGIEGERITAIAQRLEGPRTLEAAGKYVLPGAVDAHVHMALTVGGLTSSDDFASGSIAAACGGTTTILDFAQSRRHYSLEATLTERLEQASKSAIDYGLHISLLDAEAETLAAIPRLIEKGCPSFKLYTAYEGSWLDDGQIWAIFAALAEHGALPMVHCENHQVISRLIARHRAEGKLEPRYHALSRPAATEGETTGRVIDIARLTGCPVYIAHVSCLDALARIQQARQEGLPVFGETCPQYLLLSQQAYDLDDFEGAKYVIAPPLRTVGDQMALWRALRTGALQVTSTDHCPFLFKGQKERGRGDFSLIPGGMPGVETRLALMYHFGVGQGRLSLSQWVALCCTNPARLFGLSPRKGQIAIGSDADLVVFDPERQVTLRAATLHQHVDYSPYEGWPVKGYPQHVLSRSELIVEDGEFIAKTGRGLFLRRTSHLHIR